MPCDLHGQAAEAPNSCLGLSGVHAGLPRFETLQQPQRVHPRGASSPATDRSHAALEVGPQPQASLRMTAAQRHPDCSLRRDPGPGPPSQAAREHQTP